MEDTKKEKNLSRIESDLTTMIVLLKEILFELRNPTLHYQTKDKIKEEVDTDEL